MFKKTKKWKNYYKQTKEEGDKNAIPSNNVNYSFSIFINNVYKI